MSAFFLPKSVLFYWKECRRWNVDRGLDAPNYLPHSTLYDHMQYESVIGLEIHAELNTKTKMFCGSLNDSDEKHPNVNVCPVCMGHPGTLPVINEEAIQKVIRVGLALGADIPEFSQFDRKNY